MKVKSLLASSLALILATACVPAAQQGQPVTAAQAATLYQQGDTASKNGDDVTAARDYLVAAEAGNADAQRALGELYQQGRGVTQDAAQARAWYEKAAAQGNTRASLDLGILYWQGTGVPRDPEKAFTYFQAADAAGEMKASRYVGLYYEAKGDDVQAVAAYQKGAAAGDITSQYYLGRMYELGKGLAQDYQQAAKWYTTSAERGDIIASDGMVGLASLYERGLGVPQDRNKAIALYRQAAAVGNETAKAALQRLGVSTSS